MKDNFEKFVENHHDEFDVHEPDLRNWDAIEQNLSKPKNKKLVFFPYLKYAASIVVLLSIGYFSRYYFEDNKQLSNAETEIQINIPEVNEAEAYYSAQVDKKSKELFSYTSLDASIKTDVKRDLSELDSVYAELKKDLKDNVANEEIVQAMIQNYRLKLEILEDLLEMLEKEKNDSKKIEKYEM